MEITVIRHTSLAIEAGICYGQMEVPLASTYQENYLEFKGEIKEKFDAVFCSPLNRCQTLATDLGYSFVVDERLLEFNFGDWEGKKWTSISEEEIGPWYADFVNYSTPKGESMQQMYKRLVSFLTELRETQHTNVLVVTHGGIIRLLWCYVLQIPLENAFKIPVDFQEIFQFHLGNIRTEDFILRKA